MVSHPETGSDSPIGSDQDRGRDRYPKAIMVSSNSACLKIFLNIILLS